MIVLDASAAVELLLETDSGWRVFERIARKGETLHAPHLMSLEVVSTLREQIRRGLVTESRATEALSDFGDLAVTRYVHELLLARIWELRANATAYDAAYLALAELLDAPLITHDRKLERIPGHSAQVEVI